jgi:hypothetical protein
VALDLIGKLFASEEMTHLNALVSDTLRIAYRAGIEINEGVMNLIFCVFNSFQPELNECILKED